MAFKGPIKYKNFFEFSCKTLRGETVNFSKFKGKVVLVENVASMWDTTTRDYTQMNELAAKFGSQLVILGFPCNQFNHQENGNGEEIYISLKHIRPGNGFVPAFELMEKVEVNGANTHPIFEFLRERLNTPHDDGVSFMGACRKVIWDPVTRTDIAWNFEKFLIAPDGKPYRRYSRHYQTINIQSDIKELITKYEVDTK